MDSRQDTKQTTLCQFISMTDAAQASTIPTGSILEDRIIKAVVRAGTSAMFYEIIPWAGKMGLVLHTRSLTRLSRRFGMALAPS
jgi:hypothetical protein